MSDFTCYVVEKDSHDQIKSGLTRRSLSDLSEGEVLIKVAYSSLNYKDALPRPVGRASRESFHTSRESTRPAKSPSRPLPIFKMAKRFS